MQMKLLKNWQVVELDRSLEAFASWLQANPGPEIKPEGNDNASDLVWLATPRADASFTGHPKFSPKNGYDIAATDGLFFDVDGPACTAEAFKASVDALTAAGIGFVYSQSHNVTEAQPFKGHVQLVFAEPCPAEYHAAVWRAVHVACFPLVDPRQHSPVRGRNAPKPGARLHVQPGALVDWRAWLAKAPARSAADLSSAIEAPTQRADQDEHVAKSLASIWGPKTTGDRAFGALGGWLARLGISRSRAAKIATGVAYFTQSTHPNVERRIDQAYDGEHGLGFTALFGALSQDATGVAAQAEGGRLLGGVAEHVRDVLQAAEALLRNSVTPDPTQERQDPIDVPTDANAAPTQDLSGLQLAHSGWPWILRKGQWSWLHEIEGAPRYWGPIEKADLKLQVRRTHCHVIALRGPKGGDIADCDFERMYQQRIDTLKATYLARTNSWDPIKRELTLAALKWADLPATYHPDVDRWLRALGGADYDRLAQWLASCLALDRPAPALYIHGDANVGKTLLVVGLAKLWSCQPAPFKEALDSFNEAAATCPLVFADEGFPDGMSFADFRAMVTEPSRRVNEKFKPKYPVEGCVRIVLAANNANALRYQRTGALTAADLAAIADRLLVINAHRSAQQALVGVDKTSMADRRIAEHVLWLANMVELEGPDQRMCAKPQGALSVLDALQTARYSEIMRTLDRLRGLSPDIASISGVHIRDGRLLVNVLALFKACQPHGLSDGKGPKEQDVRDFVNAFRSGPSEQLWAAKPDGRGTSIRVHPIDAKRFESQLQHLD